MKAQPTWKVEIPRADAAIAQTIERLRSVQFAQDPLFDVGTSFRISYHSSAIKREGRILEAAIRDAIAQVPGLQLLACPLALPRRPDILFETLEHALVALEIKRGTQHDSKTLREFRRDLVEIPAMLRTAWPLLPYAAVHFHIVFVDGKPRLPEGLGLRELSKLYGLPVEPCVRTARQRYSARLHTVLMERMP